MSVQQTLSGWPRTVTQEQVAAYADASSDHNPLHLDEAFAATTMFGKRIAHGMLVLAFVSEMMHSSFGDAWDEGGYLNVRFRAPVAPGDRVAASGMLKSSEGATSTYAVVVSNQDGIDVITGDATVTLGTA